MTDVFNSVTNVWLIYCVFQIARSCVGLTRDLKHFDEHVDALTYGDDIIIAADNETLCYFNRVNFRDVAEDVGMEVTGANKTAEIVPCDALEDLTFLKSPFVVDGDVVRAPLPIKVIHREIMWMRKRNYGDVVIARQQLDTAVAMMAHHGEEAVEKFIRELQELGIDVEFSYARWFRELKEKQDESKIEYLHEDVSEGFDLFLFSGDDMNYDEWDDLAFEYDGMEE